MKSVLIKSFLGTIAMATAITLFTTGCSDEMPIGEKKSGVATPKELLEKSKTAGKDLHGKDMALAMDGKNVTGPLTSESFPLQSAKQKLAKLEIPDGVEKIEDNKIYLWGEKGAFGNCKSLTTVTLPNSLIKLGEGSFHHCVALSQINIPTSLQEIGSRAFEGCINLKTLPLQNVKKIENRAFADCINLDLTIPASVEEVGDGAFNFIKSVSLAPGQKGIVIRKDNSIVRPSDKSLIYVKPNQKKYYIKDVSRIGDYTFRNITTDEIIIDASVSKIGKNAFESTVIKKITIPQKLKEIGSYAFKNSKITSIQLPEGLNMISEGLFYGSSIQKITIPKNVTYIQKWAFKDAKNLTEVILPKRLRTIEKEAFIGCENLTVNIPANVNYVANDSFSRVKKITVDPANKTYKVDSRGALIDIPTKTLLYVPQSVTGEYKVPDGIKIIGSFAFLDNNDITKLYIPDSVEQINQHGALYNLKEISVPAKTNINKYQLKDYKDRKVIIKRR